MTQTMPAHMRDAFNCPHCNAYAHQRWTQAAQIGVGFASGPAKGMPGVTIATCVRCGEISLWVSTKMIYPDSSSVAPPNPDMNKEIQEDYREAAAIVNRSPRGAASLLRLSIQELCRQLGLPGKDLDTDIAALVTRGLDPKIQKSLDVVRVVGNNAVHPGEMDIRDGRDVALKLFELVNLIAQMMVTQPKEIDELYGSLPAGAKEHIGKRDAVTK